MNIKQLCGDPQRTKDWRVARLGSFSGSEIYKLLKSSRTKGEVFGDVAKDYIFNKMAERDISSKTIGNDEIWEQYLDLTSATSKAMRFGTDNEQDARIAYTEFSGNKVVETSSIPHAEIPNFAASPDGVIADENGDIVGCLEIKVPLPQTFMRYACEIKDNETMKKVKEEYYYQMQAEMMVTGAQWCDFCIYQPFLIHKIKVVRIYRCDESCELIKERLAMAEEFITSMKNGR